MSQPVGWYIEGGQQRCVQAVFIQNFQAILRQVKPPEKMDENKKTNLGDWESTLRTVCDIV